MFFRGFLGVVPTRLIETIVAICRPQDWRAVYVACSGTFRTERGLLGKFPHLAVHSNDVSLLSTALGRAACGQVLSFRFVRELAWMEEVELDQVDRITAILLALNYSSFVKGKDNRFKQEHAGHLRSSFSTYLIDSRPMVEKTLAAMPLKSYFAGDFRDHIETAIAGGAGVLAYPPTFRGGYERLFAFVHENVEWEPPSYRLFDPATEVTPVLRRLQDSGIPYFLYLDQEVEGFDPLVRFEQPGKRTIFGYGRASAASYRAPRSHSRAFAYRSVELEKIKKNSQLRVVPVPEANISFLREAFLKKGIMFGTGDYGVLVYIDDMLAGAISYRKPMSAGQPLFVLTDLSTTRDGRIAKLIARLATCREVFRPLEHRMIVRFSRLTTKAYSEHPEAMKYRGSWKVEKRIETRTHFGRYEITYGSEVRDESLKDCFAWWWTRDGSREVAAALGRAAQGRSAAAASA